MTSQKGEARACEGGSEHGSPKRCPQTRQLSVLRSYMGMSCSSLSLTCYWGEENAAAAHVNSEGEPVRTVLNGDVEPMEVPKVSITLTPKWGTCIL